jgi:hypothetical protein
MKDKPFLAVSHPMQILVFTAGGAPIFQHADSSFGVLHTPARLSAWFSEPTEAHVVNGHRATTTWMRCLTSILFAQFDSWGIHELGTPSRRCPPFAARIYGWTPHHHVELLCGLF